MKNKDDFRKYFAILSPVALILLLITIMANFALITEVINTGKDEDIASYKENIGVKKEYFNNDLPIGLYSIDNIQGNKITINNIEYTVFNDYSYISKLDSYNGLVEIKKEGAFTTLSFSIDDITDEELYENYISYKDSLEDKLILIIYICGPLAIGIRLFLQHTSRKFMKNN